MNYDIKQEESETIFKNLNERILQLEEFVVTHEKKKVMAESYKRMNILVHGIVEEKDSPWETHVITLFKFKSIVEEGLQIDPAQIAIADIHRLPQRPIFRSGHKVNRPIIVKLVHTKDKSLLFRQLKNLKTLTERKRNNKGPVYLTDHLPEVFLRQKKVTNAAIQESM